MLNTDDYLSKAELDYQFFCGLCEKVCEEIIVEHGYEDVCHSCLKLCPPEERTNLEERTVLRRKDYANW